MQQPTFDGIAAKLDEIKAQRGDWPVRVLDLLKAYGVHNAPGETEMYLLLNDMVHADRLIADPAVNEGAEITWWR